jgi:hypothetical protein
MRKYTLYRPRPEDVGGLRLAQVIIGLLATSVLACSTTRDSDVNDAATDLSGDTQNSDSATDMDTAVPASPSDTGIVPDASEVHLDSGGTDTDGSDAADTSDDGSDTTDTDDDAVSCPLDESCTPLFSLPVCGEGRCDGRGDCVASPIVGCCTSDAECPVRPGLPACERPRCLSLRCADVPIPGCCLKDDECDDGATTTADVCGPETGLCTHCAPGSCDGSTPVFSADFEFPTLLSAGFSLTDDNLGDPVRWQISHARAYTGARAAYLGDTRCRTYYSGGLDEACVAVDPFEQDSRRILASVTTPPIALPSTPDDGGATASVWVWSDVEPLAGGLPNEADVLRVSVLSTTADVPVWPVTSTLAVGKTTQGEWRQLRFDMTPWRGQTVRLRFAFDTFDGRDNRHEGVFLDDLEVSERCASRGCCVSDSDCDHLTHGPCEAARCTPLTNGGGRVCTVASETPGVLCETCDPNGQSICNDDNPCTTDQCSPDGRCLHDTFCCFRETHFEASFETGLSGWTVSDDAPDDGVMWQTSTTFQSDGAASAWFGDAATGTYDVAAPVEGAITSGPIQLPPAQVGSPGLSLSFVLSLATEWDGTSYDNPTGLDRLSIEIISLETAPSIATEVWSSDGLGGTTQGVPTNVMVPIDGFGGQKVQLRIGFRSGDANANAFAGPFIDALKLRTRCASPQP